MITLRNNTGSTSKLGYAVTLDSRDSGAFVYATFGATKVIGIITEAVPYRKPCKIATQRDKASVFVVGNVIKDNSIRLSKSTDRASLGSSVIAKSGDSPYLKIGDALNSGRGLIPMTLELSYVATESTGAFQPLDADLTRLADYRRIGGDTNYTQFEADGTMVMNGDAIVWEDLNFDPDRSGGAVATRPGEVIINNVVHSEFDNGNNEYCGGAEELPHQYKLGTTLYPHIHLFLKGGEGAGTTGVTFTFYWELRQSTGVTSGSIPLSATSALLGTAAGANKLDIYDNTGFAGSAELGAQLAVTIARTAGNAGDIVVTTYGVHYQIDTIGSRSLTSK